jgi:hypothetical protein
MHSSERCIFDSVNNLSYLLVFLKDHALGFGVSLL